MRKLFLLLLPLMLLALPARADRPLYTGTATVDYGVPDFSNVTQGLDEFVQYSPLDRLGRVGAAIACLGPLHYSETRQSISGNIPTGFMNKQYEFVTGGSLYHRCHLIAHRLTSSGEYNENLFTGTAYLNFGAMFQTELQIAEYISRTKNHVLYRVTPDFAGEELVCRGLIIEAQSVEDAEICFCVYCFNVQPGVVIDYRTGESQLAQYAYAPAPDDLELIADDLNDGDVSSRSQPVAQHYVLNIRQHRFHYPSCRSVNQMSEKNRQDFTGTREEVIALGYKPCGECHP